MLCVHCCVYCIVVCTAVLCVCVCVCSVWCTLLCVWLYLQVCDVAVDVHSRCFTVFCDVFVIRGAALIVHAVNTRDGDVLVPLRYITTQQTHFFSLHSHWDIKNLGKIPDTDLHMILSVRTTRLAIPLRNFLFIWSATQTGVSHRARERGVSPSLFIMSMSAPRERNKLKRKSDRLDTNAPLFLSTQSRLT